MKGIAPGQLSGSESRHIELRFRSVNGILRGDAYLLSVLLPHIYFHVTAAHNILRYNGMAIGKKDYFGELAFI